MNPTRERVKALVESLVKDRELERQWLTTLSLLEYMGARKIFKTVASRYPKPTVLHHLADEVRHADALMRLASTDSTEPLPACLCPEDARAYFAQLDRAVADRLGHERDAEICYLVVTTLVEKRAMMVYPLYRAATSRADVRQEVGRIVTEEQTHRGPIEAQCAAQLKTFGATLEEFEAIEGALFVRLLQALEDATAPATRPLARLNAAATARD